MLDSNSAKVANMEVYDKIALVSLSAQTCAIPPRIKERVYRIFILSSANMSSCMVMAMWIDRTNCAALSLLPSKHYVFGSTQIQYRIRVLHAKHYIS